MILSWYAAQTDNPFINWCNDHTVPILIFMGCWAFYIALTAIATWLMHKDPRYRARFKEKVLDDLYKGRRGSF